MNKKYYQVGSLDDLYISNSSLSAINPDEGGSYLKFEEFFKQDKEETTNKSLERGTLLHEWIEHRDDFKLLEVDKPGEKMGIICDKIIDLCNKNNFNTLSDISDDLLLEFAYEIELGNIGKKGGWKESTVLSKIRDCEAYIDEALECKDKIGVTKSMKETLENCQHSIENNPIILELLQKEGLHEFDIYYESVVEGITIKRKALIDKLIINKDKKIIDIVDFKTTSFPIGQFMGYKRMNSNAEYDYVAGAFQIWRIYRQLGVYVGAVEKWLEQQEEDFKEWGINCHIPVVETNGFFQSGLFSFEGGKWIHVGKLEERILLREVYNYLINRQR